MRRKKWLSPICLLLLFLAPGLSRAADLRFQSSTQYLWYTDPFKDQDQSDLVQYLKFGVTKLEPTGRVSAVGYGRLSGQFGGDTDPQLGDDDGLLGRLYFLYVNYALPSDHGDVRLGRQFVSVGAGSGTVDGVSAELRNLGPLRATVFAGFDVRFAETTDRTRSGNYLAGVSVGGSFFKGNNVDVSYLRKYDQDDVIRETAGIHADQRILDKAKVYADLRYDVLHGTYGEFLGGAKLFPFSAPVTFTAEYFASYPTFDADTIYTAFAVTRYREVLGRADYLVNPNLTLYGGYTRADYDGPTADIGTIGVRAKPKPVPGLGLNASLDLRSGYPGDLTGFQASADYTFGKATVSAGITWDVFQRDSMASDFTAKKYWGAGSYEFRKNMTARLRVEDTETRQFENEFQGRASVDLSF
ncbi:MAG: hypothetical protein OHK0028_15990 [Deltaproteobacteria bacterium]